jgi:rhodanese-related sulfurtransferase
MYRQHSFSAYLAFLTLFLTSFAIQANEIVSKNVDIHAFSALIAEHAGNENTQIIDVRTHKEFHAGHIKNAHVIDFYANDFIQNLKQLDKNKTYLLYCRSGNRSGKTLRLMKKLGFKAAYNMQGGMKAWTRAKYPVVKPQ